MCFYVKCFGLVVASPHIHLNNQLEPARKKSTFHAEFYQHLLFLIDLANRTCIFKTTIRCYQELGWGTKMPFPYFTSNIERLYIAS